MLKFDKVTKHFGTGYEALTDVDLEIEPSEFVFIIGPSGAGKTTLLKLITKELTPSSGSIYFGDWDLVNLPSSYIPQLRRRVATVFQDFRLLTDRTVRENVALTLEVLGQKVEDIQEDVNQILEMVGLAGKGETFPSQLSGGEAQKVVIARALVAKPEVILADEPTGNLDLGTARSIMKLLEDINKAGTTIMMATHNADLVNEMEKRVIRLDKGRVTSDRKKGKYKDD
ncbi:cell division ATP-binding protein FtsE [Candidatus Daviesbacteria bacterium]|nr:cell division ATP-binding protein FtsE [Candidatus Daviesbacteria bacterium]